MLFLNFHTTCFVVLTRVRIDFIIIKNSQNIIATRIESTLFGFVKITSKYTYLKKKLKTITYNINTSLESYYFETKWYIKILSQTQKQLF